MALREEIIKITVDTKDGVIKINGVTKSLKEAKSAFDSVTSAISQNTATTTANTAEQVKNSSARSVNYQNTTVSVDRLRRHIAFLKKEQSSLSTSSKAYTAYSKQISNANQRLFDITQTGDKLTRTNGAMASSAGLAGAATLELGRVFSDINYGIRGIANNVSQFATLFVSLSVSAGGAGKAFGELLKQLRGPLGVLLAIQAAVAAIEFLDKKFGIFGGTLSNVTDKLKESRKEIESQRVELQGYLTVLTDVNSSEEARLNAIDELEKAIPGITDKNGNLKISYEELNVELEKYIQNSLIRAEIDQLLEDNEDLFAKARRARKISEMEDDDDRREATKKFLKEEKDFFFASSRTRDEQRKRDRMTSDERLVDDFNSFSNYIEKTSKEARDRIVKLQGELQGNRTPGSEGREDVDPVGTVLVENRKKINKELLAVFVEGLEEQAQEGIKRELQELDIQFGIKKQKLKNEGATNQDLLILQEDYYKDRLQIIQKYNMEALQENAKASAQILIDEEKFRIKSTKRLNKYLAEQVKARLKILKDTTTKESDLSFNALMKRLDSEQEAKVFALQETYRLRGLDIKNNEQYQKDLIHIDQFYNNKRIAIDKKRKLEAIKAFKEQLSNTEELLSKVAESRSRSLQAQTQAIDSNTKMQLENENLTEEQRHQIRVNAEKRKEKIQQQSIQMELRYQQTLFAIKAAELVANISKDFAEGVISLKTGAANTAKTGFPQNIPLLAAYAAQAAAVISGMVNAKKQAKQALSNLGGGGSLGADPSASGIGSPTFNVVGSTQTSQIADIIGSANEKPVKAYVVSDEITNMQQLDQRIIENAGI